MSADDMMARLMAMADDDAPVAAKPEPKAKPAAKPAAKPKAEVVADPEPAPSGVMIPVVVLDDGATFSEIAGAKVCFVQPDCEQIEPEAYASGVSVSDLLTLRDAFDTILKIVRR